MNARDLRPGEAEASEGAAPLMAVLAGAAPLDWHSTDRYERSVTFRSEPLQAPLDLLGRPSLALWLEVDAPDADLAVLLYEQRQDGSRRFLSSTHQSLRWRAGDRPGPDWRRGVVEALTLERFRFAAHRIARGSRIALQLRLLDSIAYQRNASVLEAAAPVTLTVHAGATRPAALTLPAPNQGAAR